MQFAIELQNGSEPGAVSVTFQGRPDPERPISVLHFSNFGKTRETVFCHTGLWPENLEAGFSLAVNFGQSSDVFCAYLSSEPEYEFNQAPNYKHLIQKIYFTFVDGDLTILPDSAGAQVNSEQEKLRIKTFYVDGVPQDGNEQYEIIFFYTGVHMFHPEHTTGIGIYPTGPGLTNKATYDAIAGLMESRYSATIPTGDLLEPWLRSSPVHAVHFYNVNAKTKQNALDFCKKLAQDINSIIAKERGDRPKLLITTIRNNLTGVLEFLPEGYDNFGSLTPSIFPYKNIEGIERYLPKIQSSDFARLVLELYVQTLSERDRGFRFFREWSLLETIAEKRIQASSQALLDSDGNELYHENRRPITSETKAGLVYAYLMSINLPPIYQGLADGQTAVISGAQGHIDQGGEVISLYTAVAGSYIIRNQVGHSGRFVDPNPANTDAQRFATRLYRGEFSFLRILLEGIIERELSNI